MAFFGGGASAGIGGSTGATDNAILRADGTGGASLQNSSLLIGDEVISFSCTGVASTDVITAVGHNFTTNQTVRFLSLTGGSGLGTGTNYFVRDISGDTFKVSSLSGPGSAVNFTTDITAGVVVASQEMVSIVNNSSSSDSWVVIQPKGVGGLCAASPDGTATGGNRRGNNSVDWLTDRASNTQVASGPHSTISGGRRNTAGGGFSTVAGGAQNTASGSNSSCLGGTNCTASGNNSATICNYAVADRDGLFAHAGGRFGTGSAAGDAQRIHIVLRNKTTTNSAVELFGGDTPSSRLTVPSGKVMSMLINITGVKSDGTAVAHYVRQYSIKNVGGTTSEVYAPVTIGTDNAAGTSISVTANDTNDALNISCTGIASETWRWVASVDAVEVSYGT